MKTKLVIFGITGDLSRRKLLPALRHIVESGEAAPLSIIGVSRREVNIPELVAGATGDDLLAQYTSVYSMDLAERADYDGLRGAIDLKDDEQAVIYLSVPPSAATDIVDFLGEAGINTSNVKIMFEKPFGFDEPSAMDFIERTQRYFTEDQIYRIDHYMAKEVALEILRLRSDADTHHHHWSNETVERVEIVATETLDVQDRAAFYEQTGAHRDVIQGHLMQLLSLVLMDTSGDFDIEELPERRHTALLQLDEAVADKATRAQYEGYGDEVHNPGSTTETFVDLTLESDDPRWQGVPLRLVTGKALNEKKTAINIYYKDGGVDTFEEGAVKSSNDRLPDAYERVLVEAIQGRKFIYTTSPEIVRAWQILAPLQYAWEMNNCPLEVYPKGSSVEDIVK